MSQPLQEFMIPLAQIAIEGDWGTIIMPYICEEGFVSEEELEMFDRAIWFKIDSDRKEELGLNQTHEGQDSVEAYEVRLQCPTIDDLRAVKRQLRRIFIAYRGDEYSWINIPAAVFEKEDGRWKQMLAVTANLAGKYFG